MKVLDTRVTCQARWSQATGDVPHIVRAGCAGDAGTATRRSGRLGNVNMGALPGGKQQLSRTFDRFN